MLKNIKSWINRENKPGTPLWKTLLFEQRMPLRYHKMLESFLNEIDCFLKNELFSLKLNKKKRLSVLYLYAEKDRYPDSFKNLLKLLRRIYKFHITMVCMDNFNENKKTTRIKHKRYDIYNIGGDNKDWEFSGWRKGLNFLDKIEVKSDLILFVNDSFLNRYYDGRDLKFYSLKINTHSLYNLKHDEVLGEINENKDLKTSLMGYNVSSFLRTHLFAIPKNIVEKIDFFLISKKTMDKICPKKFNNQLFNKTNLLDKNLKQVFIEWITIKWYKHPELKKENWNMIRSKLKAMLNERLFTAKLRENNVKIINIWEH